MKDIILNLEKKLFAKIELEKDKFLSENYYNKETKNLFCVLIWTQSTITHYLLALI